jgi:hypothetical protein
MAKSLLDLARSLEAKAVAIEDAANKTAIDVATATLDYLAYNTPVDTSQALSNWQVSLGSPKRSFIGARVPGMFGSTQHQSAQQTIAEAVAILTNKKPGQAIYIVNNLDYIVALNEGTISRQPGGFVEAAILVGKQEIKKFKLRS